MNREIKFRQPIFVNGKFSSWHYWGFLSGNYVFVGPVADKGGDKAGDNYQYIGLHDRQNNEIYEGDRVKDINSGFIGEVIWDSDTLCFTTKFQANELWGFVPRRGKDNHCEIIGHIHDDKH